MNLREKPVTTAKSGEFSNAFKDSLRVMPMVHEMVLVDRHSNFDELCQNSPEIVKRYCDLARAGLRGLRKFDEREKQIKISGASDDANDTSERKSAFVIAYAAVAFSGFLVGIFYGWIIWR